MFIHKDGSVTGSVFHAGLPEDTRSSKSRKTRAEAAAKDAEVPEDTTAPVPPPSSEIPAAQAPETVASTAGKSAAGAASVKSADTPAKTAGSKEGSK